MKYLKKSLLEIQMEWIVEYIAILKEEFYVYKIFDMPHDTWFADVKFDSYEEAKKYVEGDDDQS